MGVANKRSLAWATAVAAARHGARIAVSYQDERLLRRVEGLKDEIEVAALIECDVSQDASIETCLREAGRALGRLDFVVHSIAFARKEELEGDVVATSREGFALAHEISAYSFLAVARAARPLLAEHGGSLVTMTFQGARRVFPNYNVMGLAKASLESAVRYLAESLGRDGIRVNAISAGPVKTLAASAVRGLSEMQRAVAERAPLRRNIEADEVAAAAVFLVSPLASGITGEILHVDAGYHVLGF